MMIFTKYEDFTEPTDILYKLAVLIISLKTLIRTYEPKVADH